MQSVRFATPREILGTFGEIADGWSAEECIAQLRTLLDRLARDTDVQDGHPRFWEHCTLMAIYNDMGHRDQTGQVGADEAVAALRTCLAL